MSSKEQITLTYMSGPFDGKPIKFDAPNVGEQLVIVIGRRDTCDINLHYDNQVSRAHARVICSARPVTNIGTTIGTGYILTFWLEDAGSRNGTFIEKERNPIRERVSLRPGMLFRVGRTWLRVEAPLTTFSDENLDF